MSHGTDRQDDSGAEAQVEQVGQVGQILARTYRLERLLVSGGMGAVYLGRHLRTGGLCAVKVLHRHSAEKAELYERFRDEARISCLLRHPNIVQVNDLDHDEAGTPFLVMELLEGEDLGERLEREGRLPLEQVLSLARQVGSALYAAHCQGVVHRDLKPQNIFLSVGLANSDAAGQMMERAKLLDFGLSKIPRPADRVTRDLLVLGTPRYLAPEAAQGQNSQLDGRADQFSLAVILYRALSGRLPFDGDDVAEVLHSVVYDQQPSLLSLLPGLPMSVAQAIDRALQKRKEDRFDTIMDFMRALTLVVQPGPTSLLPQPLTAQLPAQAAATQLSEHLFPEALADRSTVPPGARLPSLVMRSEDLRLSLRRVGLFALCGALAALPLVVVIWLRSQPRRPRQVTAQASVQADRGEPRQEVRPPPAYDPPAALAMQWLSCPSGLERVAAGNGHVQSLVAYPPLRAADGAAIGTLLGADLQVPARVLDEAQGYYRQGKFLQAIAAAHLLVGQDDALEQQAYHLLGASACALHRLQPFGEAYRQLDAAGRERLLADCQGAAAPH